MKKNIYIHYGATSFDSSIGFPIKNLVGWTKPQGGLWASRQDASFGWKAWCEAEQFRYYDDHDSFKFILKDETKIAIINSMVDLRRLPTIESSSAIFDICINFEECLRRGFDAVELCWYGYEYIDKRVDDMYNGLYGWDCDSIVVLNPEAIVQI